MAFGKLADCEFIIMIMVAFAVMERCATRPAAMFSRIFLILESCTPLLKLKSTICVLHNNLQVERYKILG